MLASRSLTLSCIFWQDEKLVNMWPEHGRWSASRLSNEQYQGLRDQVAAGPDVTLRLSNLEPPTASSSDSDVSSSKNLRSPSGGPEEADSGHPVEISRFWMPSSANAEVSSVEEKTAMLHIAENVNVAYTGCSGRPGPKLEPYSYQGRGRLRPQVGVLADPNRMAESEALLRFAADERVYSSSDLRNADALHRDRSLPLHLAGTNIPFFGVSSFHQLYIVISGPCCLWKLVDPALYS